MPLRDTGGGLKGDGGLVKMKIQPTLAAVVA
jgi:hypothetical protein